MKNQDSNIDLRDGQRGQWKADAIRSDLYSPQVSDIPRVHAQVEEEVVRPDCELGHDHLQDQQYSPAKGFQGFGD